MSHANGVPVMNVAQDVLKQLQLKFVAARIQTPTLVLVRRARRQAFAFQIRGMTSRRSGTRVCRLFCSIERSLDVEEMLKRHFCPQCNVLSLQVLNNKESNNLHDAKLAHELTSSGAINYKS